MFGFSRLCKKNIKKNQNAKNDDRISSVIKIEKKKMIILF